MQKVEGSSPFSRSSESPGNPGLSSFLGPDRGFEIEAADQ
jgi:hypothetical protein